MIFNTVNIEDSTLSFLERNNRFFTDLETANRFIQEVSGIINFFNDIEEVLELKNIVEEKLTLVSEPYRREYGDFQTNDELAEKVVNYILKKEDSSDIEFILEPTCGKGSFILTCIENIPAIKKITGIEIYLPYVWETKFKILNFFISNQKHNKPEIEIIHANVFYFDFRTVAQQTKEYKTLIIGNPPWVTNSELGSIKSLNLPKKSNFKKHAGFDAMTGKGNFDIGESIALLMLNNFNNHNGYFGFLIKNSVVKNLIFDLKQNNYRIGDSEKLNIDSKKEFNASVDACLFVTKLNTEPHFTCQELNFYTRQKLSVFGWHKNNFVYSVTEYLNAKDIEGRSQFEWRQGIKHDCSKVMELEKMNDYYVNGLKQEVYLENDLLYGLLKSSDLKAEQTDRYRKLVIVTQKKIGQDTGYIKQKYPLTYKYLLKNKECFEKRKSSIYNGKPEFSIFGVGDYSFALYKVAISGLYKRTRFTLVLPDNDKAVMLDDTCYFIGFNNLNYAKIAQYFLNHEHTQQFLKSIIFPDSKRLITKNVLMRIDFLKLSKILDFNTAKKQLTDINEEDWNRFLELLDTKKESQLALF